MKLVTIQHKKVLYSLIKGNTYINDFKYVLTNSDDDSETITDEERLDISKVKSYQVLMRHYKYTTPPIFCCVVDRVANFTRTTPSKDNVLLELDVPDDFIHLHPFDTWDYIYRRINRNRWNEDLYEEEKVYLDGKDTDGTVLCSIQAVIPCIKPEWLKFAYKIDDKFIDLCTENYIFEAGYSSNPLIYLNEEFKK